MLVKKPDMIVSGGQTGCDFGALLGAEDCGIATGGYAPKDFKTESGDRPDLGARFGLVESKSSDYAVRTRQNVEMADAVIIVAKNFLSPGTALTAKLCLELHKAIFRVQYDTKSSGFKLYWAQDLQLWLDMCEPSILAILGNRESKAPGIQQWTRKMVCTFFGNSL